MDSSVTAPNLALDNFADIGAGPALAALWQLGGMPAESLATAQLPGTGPVLPSSFAVATAAQSSIAATALAASTLWTLRQGGKRHQQVTVERDHATLECLAYSLIDGVAPPVWDPISGLYRCGETAGTPGWVRIHANFAHHRDGALALLGCPIGPDTPRTAVIEALRGWTALDFEAAAAKAGLVVAAARSFDEWDAHPQARALQEHPVVEIERIADADPVRWPALPEGGSPLQGLRVLDLTRILAGPVAGRTLAAHGADVLLVNGPHLPNIPAIAHTSRGKLSAHIDLRQTQGRSTLQGLLADSHVFLQGYRPGTLAGRGFGAEDAARLRPGIVHVSLSAYGDRGPWSDRRGFDSLVQTATGFNVAEAQVAEAKQPQAMPLQILDYAAGHLLAYGAMAALWRQQHEGGSWQVRVSLAGVGHWLRSLGRIADGLSAQPPAVDPCLETVASGFGQLTMPRHAGQLSATPPAWRRPSMTPGSHPPVWPVPVSA